MLAGLLIGLLGGFSSGLMGISPGGVLVVFSVLLLGAEQHVAQGLSLAAQVAPTSLSALNAYRSRGERSPARWLALLTPGFLIGGALGALAAGAVGSGTLRWTYVAYLLLLDGALIRKVRKPEQADDGGDHEPSAVGLAAVGLAAGFSSGFLGIGGGLATTVGLGVILRAPQHQAQMVSLVLALLPTTLPSAWIYWREGWMAPWPTLIAAILGLAVGTNLGARAAVRISAQSLRKWLIAVVTIMAVYMAWEAL